MAICKTFSPSGWDWDCPVTSFLKIGSSGALGSNDRRDFVKRASALFLPLLANIKFANDELPVHLIALGAYEAYGANRNGDAFKEAALKQYHDTFVKYARWYRNHKNKDPQQSYGVVKAAVYNPVMRRVELLVGLNMSKAAAERNGGFVADKEIEKLASGQDIAVSMACRVPFDECSFCGNRARTREEYCKTATCKAGGCYDNLTRLVKIGSDVHQLCVQNDHPSFFDISNVHKPADRVAYGSKADWITKAAEDMGQFGMDGAKTAADLGVMAPLAVILAQDQMLANEWTPYMAEQVKLAHGLAALERSNTKPLHSETKRAFAADIQPDLDFDALEMGSDTRKTAAALGALADRKIVLPLREFARLTKRSEMVEVAANHLPGVIDRMLSDNTLERNLTNNQYAPAEKLASAKQRNLAGRLVSSHSLDKAAVDHRCKLSALRQHNTPVSKSTFEKSAAESPLVEGLVRDYACYKIAALRRIAQFDNEFLLTCRLSATQNTVV